MKMFKLFAVAVLCLSLLGLCACGGDENAPAPGGNNEPTQSSSKYAVDVVGAELFADGEGGDALRIYYDFTNNSEDSTSAFASLVYSAQQNGADLEGAYAAFGQSAPESGYSMSSVRPGVTIRCAEEYTVDTAAGAVNFKVTELFDDSVVYAEESFDLANLPGAPAEAFTIATVADPSWTDDLSDTGSLTAFDVLVDTAEITETFGGDDLLRVYMEFTNTSDEAATFEYDLIFSAYQDGVQLDSGFPNEEVAEDEAMSAEVAPGETVRAATCFVLRSESNVEVEVSELFNDTVIGCEFELEF